MKRENIIFSLCTEIEPLGKMGRSVEDPKVGALRACGK
jgi:hypothetical protein